MAGFEELEQMGLGDHWRAVEEEKNSFAGFEQADRLARVKSP